MTVSSVISKGRSIGFIDKNCSDETKSILKQSLVSLNEFEALEPDNVKRGRQLFNSIFETVQGASATGDELADLQQVGANLVQIMADKNHGMVDPQPRAFATARSNISMYGSNESMAHGNGRTGAFFGAETVVSVEY